MRNLLVTLALVAVLVFASEASAYVYAHRVDGNGDHWLSRYDDALSSISGQQGNDDFGAIALNNSSGDVYARRVDSPDNFLSRFNSAIVYQAPQLWTSGMDYKAIAVNSSSGDVYAVRDDGSADYLTEYSSDLSSQQDQIWEWQSNVTFEQVAVNDTSGDVYLVQDDSDEPYNYLKRYNSSLVYQNQVWDTDYKELVINQSSGDVYTVRLDGNSDLYLSRYDSGLSTISGQQGGNVDYGPIAINSNTGDVYVERVDGNNDHWITRYDAGLTTILSQTDPGQDVIDISVDSDTGYVYAIRVDGDNDTYLSRYNSDLSSILSQQAGDFRSVVVNDVVPVLGDVDFDGFVGGADLTIILTNWGHVNVGRSRGDLDGNGTVGAADYTMVQSNWGNGTPPSEPPPGAVPEPTTLSLFFLSGLAMLRRRRKARVGVLRGHNFRFTNRIVCVLAALLALTSGLQVAWGLGSGDAGFGNMWTRSNPFVIMGTSPVYQDDPNGAPTYWGANHSYMIATESTTLVQGWTEPYAKPWIRDANYDNWCPAYEARVNADLTVPNLQGWKLVDEPSPGQMTVLTDVAAGIRGITKDRLIYVNLASDQFGNIDHLFSTVNPDLLMYDQYPFLISGSTGTGWYFDNMMNLRGEALAKNVPYWGYIQSYSEVHNPPDSPKTHRVSSESDMRMNVYSHLTTGYTGLQYYTHVQWTGTWDAGLLDANGDPDVMYAYAQDVNAEVQNLGQALRLLESTAVRFIPGDDAAPTGLTNWSAGAGGDTHITNVAIDGGQNGVGYKNGMIGFFDDYVGGKHFMLNNLDHAASTSAAAASLNFTVTFDSSVNSLLRLNRETGVQEVVALTNHQLSTTLPGGTADLYKYNTGDFLLSVPQMILEMVEVTDPGAPVGYTAYDIVATTGTNLGLMELVLDADTAGDIHQVSSDPANSTDPFDTYVTMPVTFNIFGSAVDIDSLASQVWDDDELNVAWTPAGGENSFPGAYQIARIVLKNSASGAYTVKGWQTGGWAGVELSTSFGLAGDVNGDGFVGGGDLNAVLSNWGLAGARRSQGDLTGEGDVGGADYNQVLGNWGASASEPPGAIPEPATLGMLVLGSLILCRRRHRIG